MSPCEHRGVQPVAVLAHGSGSGAAFVRRVLGPALAGAGVRVVTLEDRTGNVETVTRALRALVDRHGATLVGGVSLGAHAAARVAASRPGLGGLLAVLPAWTGPPGAVARLSGLAADELEADVARAGFPAAVRRVAGSGWAGAELALGWVGFDPASLAAALRATAASRGPTVGELRAVRCPAGIVAVRADPFHPVEVASAWARAIPAARLTVLPASGPTAGTPPLGPALVAAWRRSAAAHSSKR